MSSRRKTLDELMREGTTLDLALREGVRRALVRHKKLGESIAVWREGKVVLLPPDEIPEHLPDGNGQNGKTE